MPVTAKFHTNQFRQVVSPEQKRQEALANELLELRSKNINHILNQRVGAGMFEATTAIQMPKENPRVDMLHKSLGVDQVVLVSSPMYIDTTPQAGHNTQGQAPGTLATSVGMSSAPKPSYTNPVGLDGTVGVGMVDGRQLRGGWPVN
jgi:hypothetical protein